MTPVAILTHLPNRSLTTKCENLFFHFIRKTAKNTNLYNKNINSCGEKIFAFVSNSNIFLLIKSTMSKFYGKTEFILLK